MEYFNITLVKGQKLVSGIVHFGIRAKLGCGRGMCGQCLINVQDGSHILKKRSDIELTTLAVLGRDEGRFRLACQCVAAKTGTIFVSMKT